MKKNKATNTQGLLTSCHCKAEYELLTLKTALWSSARSQEKSDWGTGCSHHSKTK